MKEGIVFAIQHYAVHDGPGIRTLVFLKGCSLRCLWCSNPESQSSEPEFMKSASRCQHCGLCAGVLSESSMEICPSGAIRLAGKTMSVDELMPLILADRDFYRNSGGGVTLSGGEPLLQIDFCEAILRECQKEHISTALETAGHVPLSAFQRVVTLVDLFLFDIKTLDPALHRKGTGASNERILDNLRYLAMSCPEKVQVRVPLIPGYTDLHAITQLVQSLHLRPVETIPYHDWGRDKYAELGRDYRF